MGFNLGAFVHGLNMFNLTKGNAPDELFIPDNTPTEIANARLNQINRNANADFFQHQADEIDRWRKETKKTRAVAVQVAADRIALHKTLTFIEKRWREGATVVQAFKEAQKVRGEEYDKVMRDIPQMTRIENGVKSLTGDKAESRSILVDDKPVGAKPKPSYRPSGPIPGFESKPR